MTSTEFYEKGYALMGYSISKDTRTFHFRDEVLTVPVSSVQLVEINGLSCVRIDELRPHQ